MRTEDEQERETFWFGTLSNPQRPGQAMLQLCEDDGTVLLQHVFTLETWDKLDTCMRDSLGKYAS